MVKGECMEEIINRCGPADLIDLLGYYGAGLTMDYLFILSLSESLPW